MSATNVPMKGPEQQVPRSVRFRFFVGLRVPPQYREWAVSQIKSEGWPVHQVFRNLLIGLPSAAVGVVAVSLFTGPPAGSTLLTMLIVGPPTAVVVGLLIAKKKGQWVQERAIAYQLKDRH